jgi:hypothetical protein
MVICSRKQEERANASVGEGPSDQVQAGVLALRPCGGEDDGRPLIGCRRRC